MSQLKNIQYRGNKKVELIIKFIIFTASLTGLAIITAFYPITANTLIILIPSIVVLFKSKSEMFEKIKLITLILMKFLIIFAALRLFNPQIYIDLVLLMLVVNISEAVITDLLKNKKIYNAISGFAVATGVIVLRGVWAYGAPIGNYFVVNGFNKTVTILYIVAYSMWSMLFVFNQFSTSISILHFGFIIAPIFGAIATLELGAFGGIGLWMLLRSNSLAIGGWMQISAKTWFENEFYIPTAEKAIQVLKNKNFQASFMIIILILIGIIIFISVQNDAIGFQLPPFSAPIKT